MEYVEIPQKCPECGNGLPCRVEALTGFAYREPDYPVQCGHCRETVRLDLPGPPIEINTAAPPPRRPRFPRWPMQGLKLAWRVVRAADFVRHVIEEHWPELFRQRGARPRVA